MKAKLGQAAAACLAALLAAAPAHAADEQAKIDLVKKVYQTEQYARYASPSFQKIIRLGNKAAEKADPEMACEMYEHYAIGLGNGDSDVKNLKITPMKGNLVRATFRNGDEQVSTDFDISCTKGRCVINDVNGYRDIYRRIIRTRSCGD
ncbi:hypothetical protein [Bergeriella denitrificans]|uniref:Periplasmic protein n=1 Tax=Bergeriella denitrificans TaxID=494 RepID=A0A378UHF7_BERDE|nr:hypothetical protein [Bergeriella denitrificans]STZ76756.1 Uncharacterised protein [Bergeriella denitrificans]